jgi:hypothetical protein
MPPEPKIMTNPVDAKKPRKKLAFEEARGVFLFRECLACVSINQHYVEVNGVCTLIDMRVARTLRRHGTAYDSLHDRTVKNFFGYR